MKCYLFDTSICVFLFRNRFGIADKLNQIGMSCCYVSEVTIAELKYGAYKSNRKKENLTKVEQFITDINVVPFLDSIDFFAKEKVRLQKLGTPVEDFDLLIASAAYANNLILVTDNIKHFINIKDLKVENWIQR